MSNEFEVKPLPKALEEQIERCGEILMHAREIGQPGLFLVMTLERDIKKAREAQAKFDPVEMLRMHVVLSEYKE